MKTALPWIAAATVVASLLGAAATEPPMATPAPLAPAAAAVQPTGSPSLYPRPEVDPTDIPEPSPTF